MNEKEYNDYIIRVLTKDITDMGYNELSDYLQYIITDKMGKCNNPELKDIFYHIRSYFRISDLIHNRLKAVSDNNRVIIIELLKMMPVEMSNYIMGKVKEDLMKESKENE